ncbi:AcrR family transcriptional regulator [Pseudarthrobacter siccitolerans]|uniref:AcrR family transcriptional regulator n=1 Tax=Pseudarthrobacter siccitolerans TaxID=861266 RepID=A0ABU0PM99_9MICC|nr:TetR/AcrR family transcriptional regulator [Pseudarthrobacter siccitolerans]MDQ0675076.1 AcrR family transcriptional regulator [Pseudarthrobacter siccitolerans]
MSQVTNRGPYAKTAAKRASIARAALDVVLERGHRGLTTAEVAERAGVSERTMLYNFPSRDHLLVAALELEESEAMEFWPEGRTDTLEDALSSIPGFVAARGGAHPEIIRLFSYLSSAAQDPAHPAHAFMLKHNERAISGFSRLVQRWQEAGLARPDVDPRSVGRQLLAVWSGLQGQWLVDPSFNLVDEVSEAFRRLSGQRSMEAKQRLDELISQF